MTEILYSQNKTTMIPLGLGSLNPRILVVDDNREIHNDFRKILLPTEHQKIDSELDEMEALFNDVSHVSQVEESFATVDSAFQGEEAIELVKESHLNGQPYSLAFIDVRMPPGIDGIETTKRILELDPEIQVVICSAYSDYSWHEIVERLSNSNRFLILKKPFDNIEVRQIASVLHSRWVETRSDVLTGLLNRRAFAKHLTQQRTLARESGKPLSCIMVDLDYFKRVNDIYGHLVGDNALVAAAQVLRNQCRPGDLICRYGGEEFCVLLKDQSESEAYDWAELARTELSELSIDTGDNKISVTGSFGVASLENELMPDNGLFLEAADQALFAAKKSGRNRVLRFSELDKDQKEESNALTLFKYMTAKHAMKPIKAISNTESFEVVVQQLISKPSGIVPVIDNQGAMLGMLSQQDLLLSLAEKCPDQVSIDDVMQTDIVCYSEDTPLADIYSFLTRVSLSQVVITKNDKPSGVIGRTALLQWLADKAKAKS